MEKEGWPAAPCCNTERPGLRWLLEELSALLVPSSLSVLLCTRGRRLNRRLCQVRYTGTVTGPHRASQEQGSAASVRVHCWESRTEPAE